MPNLSDPAVLTALLLEHAGKRIEAEKRADEAEGKVAYLAPKAEALDRISAGTKSITFTEAAEILGVKRADMTSRMHAQGWVYRQNGSWVAYQQHIKNSRLEYKEGKYTDDDDLPARRPYCHLAASRMYSRPSRHNRRKAALVHPQSSQDFHSDYLSLFVEKFGDTYWRRLAPGPVRKWLLERAAEGGASGAHGLYRVARAFFGKVRLVYDSVDPPGFVPANSNPLTSLDLHLPVSTILVWPRAAVEAFVALADAEGQPSIGDAVVMMGWLGVRRQDWLSWPADVFDRDLVAFRQTKTHVPNVLPWSMIPPLVARVAAAKARRTADAVTATTFFHDPAGRPWSNAQAFRKAFNKLRTKLVEQHPSFPTRYYVGLIEGDPLALPSAELTMRTMRHTCVTLCFDAGIPPDLIGGITGHSPDEINDILAHYPARTADRAAAALQLRIDHEAKEAKR